MKINCRHKKKGKDAITTLLGKSEIIKRTEVVDALISRKKISFSLVLRESSQVLLKAAARKVDIEVEITVGKRASRNEAFAPDAAVRLE